MTVHYTDEQITLHHGGALDVARQLPYGAADCIVTSPPYFGLRDYGTPGQYGLEASPADYVENLRELFNELRRVLIGDGTLWLNIGDSYARKNLLGIPWRVAFALQGDGWILRNAIVWNKPNGLPDPTKDRLTGRYEHIFLFVKRPKYWFDLDAIREPAIQAGRKRADKFGGNKGDITAHSPGSIFTDSSARKNPGDVWSITTKPFPKAHFATFPVQLPHRCILAGCKPGGVVLDPFSGSGTTGLAAIMADRRYVGIDINAPNHDLALKTRLHNRTL
jgi:DNA modification methylase